MQESEMNSKTKLPEYVERLKSKRSRKLFAEILACLNEGQRYRDDSFTTVRLAKELGTNVRYISAVVLANTGDNYKALVNKMRLHDVEKMFRSRRYDHLTVEEIIVMSGFASRQTFYKAFKKRFGSTPSEYRLMIKEKRQKT